MTLHRIRRQLAAYRPFRIEDEQAARAAVAMVLREREGDSEVLLIERASRESDPWSGHMALPGGRFGSGDADLTHTAARETWEEVGIDLAAHAEPLGALDEIRAVARDRPLDLVISPLVYALERPAVAVPNPVEVNEVVWVPLSHLRSAAAQTIYRRRIAEIDTDFPAFGFGRYTIWGLTYRILQTFFQVIEES